VAVTMTISDQASTVGQDGRVTPRASRPKRRWVPSPPCPCEESRGRVSATPQVGGRQTTEN
jgi:hypothetical protein